MILSFSVRRSFDHKSDNFIVLLYLSVNFLLENCWVKMSQIFCTYSYTYYLFDNAYLWRLPPFKYQNVNLSWIFVVGSVNFKIYKQKITQRSVINWFVMKLHNVFWMDIRNVYSREVRLSAITYYLRPRKSKSHG